MVPCQGRHVAYLAVHLTAQAAECEHQRFEVIARTRVFEKEGCFPGKHIEGG
jgi:hypothetical protein